MISYCAYLYAFTAARLYSDPKVFLNIVEPNKSASVYNANIDHSVNETLGTLTPGILFGYTELIILVITCYFVLSWLFFNFCPSCDFCPKFYLSRYWKLDKQVMTKKLPSYYDILSEEQREALLIEEIQTRKRTGIQHLSDDVLKKLLLSIGRVEGQNIDEISKKPQKNQNMGINFSYDLLFDKGMAQELSYVQCSQPQRVKLAPGDQTRIRLDNLDKVRIAVDFAYLDEKRAKQFSFRQYSKDIEKKQ